MNFAFRSFFENWLNIWVNKKRHINSKLFLQKWIKTVEKFQNKLVNKAILIGTRIGTVVVTDKFWNHFCGLKNEIEINVWRTSRTFAKATKNNIEVTYWAEKLHKIYAKSKALKVGSSKKYIPFPSWSWYAQHFLQKLQWCISFHWGNDMTSKF